MEPRPTRLSPAVVRVAAERMLVVLRETCSDLSGFTSPKLVDQLAQALIQTDDAFHRGALLQTEGWPVDQRVVDVLHSRAGHENLALVEAEAGWTIQTGVRAQCKEGDIVTIQVGHNFVQAKVEAVRQDRARAIVQVTANQAVEVSRHDVPAERILKVWHGGQPYALECLREQVGFRKIAP